MGVILRYNQFLETYKTRGYRIIHLGSYKKMFPINANPMLAGIIADLIGDGHLQGDPKWRIDFTSKSIQDLKKFEKTMNFLFNVDGKIRKCNSNKYKTYNIAINSSPIARILFLCGVPTGQKVLNAFKIPTWIIRDKECFRSFCRRLFSCEGNVAYDKTRVTPQIRLEMWKATTLIKDGERFIKDISHYMSEYFAIDSVVKIQNRKNIRKDGVITQPIRLYIFGDSVQKFYHEIGFDGLKQISLKALLSK